VKHIFDSEIKRQDNENNFFTVVYIIHFTLLGYEIQEHERNGSYGIHGRKW
jgi:hypothetical protein